jgi:signal transduction histidine kinase
VDRVSAQTIQVYSLRTKLLIFVAALVLLPGSIYAVIAVTSARTALTRAVGRQLAQEARNTADRLAASLRAERESLASFAKQDVMREIRVGDLDKRISSVLASLSRGNPSHLDLLVLDRDDRVVAASNPALLGRRQDALLGFDDGPGIRGPVASRLYGRPILRFSTPVPDPDVPTASLGRLVAFSDWARETAVTARVRANLATAGVDADVVILDAAGVVIGGAPRPEGRWRVGSTLRLSGSGAVASDDEAAGRTDREAGILYGQAPFPRDLPGWSVVVSQPLAEALAPARHTAGLLGLTLAGVLLVALALALVAARRVTRPLAELTVAADAIGRGDAPASSPVPVRSHDEIGTLATAFNRMSEALGRAERELVDAAKFAFVGELAAGVAHEVRTPLGVLQSSAQLLERSLGPTDSEAAELLQLLRDEVHRIDRIVSGLLELGRPRSMRVEASPLGQIVFHAVDFAEAQAREKNVMVRRQPAVPDPVVLCDPELIYQVALNLLVNAIQILPPGGTVDVTVSAAHDGYAAFAVHDDGPGIPSDLRERIFEPFFTRREGGSGLGLTFVRRVVQEHRGRIAVDGAPGRGTTFRVELPAAGALA